MTNDLKSPDPTHPAPEEGGAPSLPFQKSMPAPPDPDAPPVLHAHVMTGAAPSVGVPRSPTMPGIADEEGVVVPAPPLTEVVPAPAVRRDLEDSDPVAAEAKMPKPRPSETMVGSRSPLHTAEDANTAVDVSSLTPGDAERIIAAADADARASPKRPVTLLAGSGALPPPPGTRRSSIPPAMGPSSSPDPFPKIGPLRKGALLSAGAAVSPSTRSSFPPPPGKRANTLVVFGAPPVPHPPVTPGGPNLNEAGSLRAFLARPGANPQASLTPKPATARPSTVPPPPEPASAPPPPPPRKAHPPPKRDSMEEISASFLLDDASGGVRPASVPQAISSDSLVEDPPSTPDLIPDEPAPLAAYPDPFASMPLPPPPPPFGAEARQGFAPVASADDVLATVPEAPSPLLRPEAPPPSSGSLDGPTSRERPTIPAQYVDTVRPKPLLDPAKRPPWLLPVAAVGAVMTLAIAVTLLVVASGALRSARPEPSPARVASAAAPPAPSAVPVAPPPVASAAPLAESPAPSGAPCILAGAPHVIAPKALLRAGIETVSTGDRIALGVGLGDRDGLVVALDPSTFVALGTSRARSDEPLRRVLPVLGGGAELSPLFETSKKRAVGLEAIFPVAAETPFIVGVEDGALVWAPSRNNAPTQLWPLAGTGPVEALRAVVLPKHEGYAIAFRQGAAIYVGALHADKSIHGDLTRISALGPAIGAPTLAANADHILVAWADRPGASAPWSVRWMTWKPGSGLNTPTPFPVPPGGMGGQVMSPALTSLAGGRFVIVWTEGDRTKHEVRAQALDAQEQPVGTALTVSAEGVNAGQGTPALTPDGRGAVAFLSSPNGASASVVAVPIVCPSAGP